MLDAISTPRAAGGVPSAAARATALVAGWRDGLAIVNLRGDPADTGFADAVRGALGVPLPLNAGATSGADPLRVVWVGPDDWFVVGPRGHGVAIATSLRAALAGRHAAVTDVSSGYEVLSLSGSPVREVLAGGCPLDLHPRAFGTGRSAGTVFFKASVWLWQTDAAPAYELLVRRSFAGYVWTMLERSTRETGLVMRQFAA